MVAMLEISEVNCHLHYYKVFAIIVIPLEFSLTAVGLATTAVHAIALKATV